MLYSISTLKSRKYLQWLSRRQLRCEKQSLMGTKCKGAWLGQWDWASHFFGWLTRLANRAPLLIVDFEVSSAFQNPEVRPEPVQETRLPGQISVHRVGEDAREITEAELNRVRNLLPLNIRVDCGPQNSSRPVRFTVISARRNLAHNLSRSRFQAPGKIVHKK